MTDRRVHLVNIAGDQDSKTIALLLDDDEAAAVYTVVALLDEFSPVGTELRAVDPDRPGDDSWMLQAAQVAPSGVFADVKREVLERLSAGRDS